MQRRIRETLARVTTEFDIYKKMLIKCTFNLFITIKVYKHETRYKLSTIECNDQIKSNVNMFLKCFVQINLFWQL